MIIIVKKRYRKLFGIILFALFLAGFMSITEALALSNCNSVLGTCGTKPCPSYTIHTGDPNQCCYDYNSCISSMGVRDCLYNYSGNKPNCSPSGCMADGVTRYYNGHAECTGNGWQCAWDFENCSAGYWSDSGSPYDCCDVAGTSKCTCQNQVWIEGYCDAGACQTRTTATTQTLRSNCSSCGTDGCSGLPSHYTDYYCFGGSCQSSSYCNISICGAECINSTDCLCQPDGCVGNNYYDYPAYGSCVSIDCTCSMGTNPGLPCAPTISYNDSRCGGSLPPTCAWQNDGYCCDPVSRHQTCVPTGCSGGECTAGNTRCVADATCAAAFDFSVSISPPSGSAARNGSVSANVITNLISGTTQNVSFSASNLPSGASVSFSPPNCNPSCSSAMTINIAADTPVGSYSVNVCGIGGGRTHCVVYKLTVTEVGTPINPPAVTTNDATNVTQTSATLNAVLDNLGYDPGLCPSCSAIVWFDWGTDPINYGASTAVQSRNSIGSFSADISGFTPGATYYFRARAKNGFSW